MAVTTIKVEVGLRDELRREADRDGVTLGGLLHELLAERARARRFEALRTAIRGNDDEDAASWRAEVEAWGAAQAPLDGDA